jgi:hypothetical protein
MKQKYTGMVTRRGQFIGRPIQMGKKKVIIIPTEFHDEIDKVLNKMLKFTWEEILDSK